MKLSEDLKWRGLIKDKTFADDSWLDEPKAFYWGVDAASSDSLTIGNLAAALFARRLAEAGWKAVLLAGGATSLVGDPGGKEEERQLQAKETVAKNIKGISAQVEKLFAGQKHETVDNIDWLGDINLLDFLRDTGKFFPMSELIQREFVTARLGEESAGISYAEFSYSLLQGYDFWHLFKKKGVVLQVGASDQWGNMLSGVQLIRKKEGQEAHALSMPLVINKATGKKFGKSEAGAIWLDPAKTSPAEFYQFWINASDDEVEEYFKVFTLMPKDKIEAIIKDHKADPPKRIGQKKLAEEVTLIVHGPNGLDEAQRHANSLAGGEISQTIKLPAGVSIVEALVQAGLASSNSDARRVVEGGGVYVNNEKFSEETLQGGNFENNRLILRRGKALKDSVAIELT